MNSFRRGVVPLALQLALPVLILAGALWIFQISDIDLIIQDRIYDFATQAWPFTKADRALRLIFYNGSKIALIAFAVVLGIALLRSFRDQQLARFRRQLIFVLVVLAVVPSLAATGKAVTNVYCPLKLERYGGAAPYVRLFDGYPDSFVPKQPGHCFPAGHASGGFSLLALFFVFEKRAWRAAGLSLGLGMGWLMGGYQMLVGAHFLSDTVTTMILAWIICVLAKPILSWKARSRKIAN